VPTGTFAVRWKRRLGALLVGRPFSSGRRKWQGGEDVFLKLRIPPADNENRRVRAVLTYLAHRDP